MKTAKIFVVVCFILFVSNIFSQFTSIPVPESSGLLCAATVDQHVVCVGGGGGIWKSVNDGLSPVRVYTAYAVREMEFSGQTGYAIQTIDGQAPYRIHILKTTDAGSTWNICYTPQDSITFTRLFVKSPTEIFATYSGAIWGRDACLFRSTDGGTTWNVVYQTHVYAFQGVTGDNLGNIFVAGSWYWSSNDLVNWDYYQMPVVFPFTNTKFANNRLYVGGDVDSNNTFYPAISYSTNQGVSWRNFVFPDSGQCNNITFAPDGTGYTNGSRRYSNYDWIAKTTDQGETWQEIYGSTFTSLSGITAGPRYMYSVGQNVGAGVIVKYDPTLVGINSNTSIPKKFELKQNYPNPFNPATTISYSTSVYTHVNITIFDINGRKVETLVDKEQNAGSYKISFNASGLSSGTYFYRISAGKFSETKKMILVK